MSVLTNRLLSWTSYAKKKYFKLYRRLKRKIKEMLQLIPNRSWIQKMRSYLPIVTIVQTHLFWNSVQFVKDFIEKKVQKREDRTRTRACQVAHKSLPEKMKAVWASDTFLSSLFQLMVKYVNNGFLKSNDIFYLFIVCFSYA